MAVELSPTSDHLLSIRDLTVEYQVAEAPIRAVVDFDLSIARREIVGLVGESGSGKSTVGYAVMGYLGSAGQVIAGSIHLIGRDLVGRTRAFLRSIRGREVAMVFQDPQSSFNPAFTVGNQATEGVRRHRGLGRSSARDHIIDWFSRVGLPDPSAVFDRYPHQLSGGQLQRVMIAMAMAPEPQLLIMDEPTTSLDVTTQARIIALIDRIRREANVGILYISHDLGVVSSLCDRVTVMHRGRVVETGPTRELIDHPRHPYSHRLIASLPRTDRIVGTPLTITSSLPESPGACGYVSRCAHAEPRCGTLDALAMRRISPVHAVRCIRWAELDGTVEARSVSPIHSRQGDPILVVEKLRKVFHHAGKLLVANDGIDLAISPGESLALIGESGAGKSTVAKCILGLEQPSSGVIRFKGESLPFRATDRPHRLRGRIQMVFQNPDSSLNPRRTVAEIVTRPLILHGRAHHRSSALAMARALLEEVELPGSYLDRYPHELSGGEKQRVAIARAFSTSPDLIVCDEPVSALDVSVQAAVLGLFRLMQSRTGVSYLFITHNLGVVRQIANRAAVLRGGRICQVADIDQLFERPHHPYVSELLDAMPGLERGETRINASLEFKPERHVDGPAPACPFFRDCPLAIDPLCRTATPPWRTQNNKVIACHQELSMLANPRGR